MLSSRAKLKRVHSRLASRQLSRLLLRFSHVRFSPSGSARSIDSHTLVASALDGVCVGAHRQQVGRHNARRVLVEHLRRTICMMLRQAGECGAACVRIGKDRPICGGLGLRAARSALTTGSPSEPCALGSAALAPAPRADAIAWCRCAHLSWIATIIDNLFTSLPEGEGCAHNKHFSITATQPQRHSCIVPRPLQGFVIFWQKKVGALSVGNPHLFFL